MANRQQPSPRPRRIADFNLGPQDAERFLERERRENDRLEKLIRRVVAASDSIDEQQSGGLHHSGPHQQASTGGFKVEDPPRRSEESPWRRGAASAVPTSRGTSTAEPPLSASQHQPANHADEEDALDFARRILRAVETNAPEAAHFTPEDIETARYYTSIFDQAPAPEPRPP